MDQKLAIQTRVVSWQQFRKKLKIGTSQKSQIQSEMIQIFNLEHSYSGFNDNLWFVNLQSRHIFCLFNITCSWIDCFYMHNLCSIMHFACIILLASDQIIYWKRNKNFNSEEGKLVNGQWLIRHSTDQTFFYFRSDFAFS